jgi:Uma2 family endonuclease
MHMVGTTRYWTVDEVRALPEDDRRYEVIDGVLIVDGTEVPGGDLDSFVDVVTPAPSWDHQRIALAIAARLLAYLEAHSVGTVIIAPADARLGEALVQPDVFVVSGAGSASPPEHELHRLLLAIEVVSPGTARRDRFTKRRLYQREGVPEYWIVDLDARAIERWRPEEAPSPLVIELEALFRRVHGDRGLRARGAVIGPGSARPRRSGRTRRTGIGGCARSP